MKQQLIKWVGGFVIASCLVMQAALGIVYGSDAIASDKVKVVGRFPEGSHKPVEYPMAIVKDHRTLAVNAFYSYLTSPAAAAIFKHYGFIPRK